MAQSKRSRADLSGLTVVEVAAILSVAGMIMAVAIPTLARAVRASKVAEASEQLEALYQASAAYYATARAGNSTFCLPEAAGPAPALPSPASVLVDFRAATTPGAVTWRALGFSPQLPLRFRYTYLPSRSGCAAASTVPPASLILRAEGDMDGDGIYSNFERHARIEPNGKLTPEPVLHISDRIE